MSALAVVALRALAVLGLMLLNGVVLIYMLRKVLAHLHGRLGPMRVGWHGTLQTIADVLKLLTKEDFAPAAADRWLFRIAPFAIFVPSLAAYAALPFSERVRATVLDTGLLYSFAALSVVPIGVLMAGWASNNKWSLIGGMRAAAQQIAYEVPLLLSVLGVVMLAGTLDLGRIVEAQSGVWLGFVPRWFIFPQFVGFLIFLAAGLAELNQTPFDLSEAESELITGFASEYSGMRFGFMFLAEFSNSFVISALAVTLFFGGWLGGFGIVPGPVVFVLKTYLFIALLMWIRGTWPRVRIDQMLAFGWKLLIPLSLAWTLLSGVWLRVAG